MLVLEVFALNGICRGLALVFSGVTCICANIRAWPGLTLFFLTANIGAGTLPSR